MQHNAATPDELLDHAEWLRSLALRLAQDEAAAEDLVQDTWAAALARPPRTGNLRPWLAVVLERFARRSRRGELRRKQRERIAAAERPERSDAEVHEAFGAQRELAELVAGLPEPYRTTLMRRYYDGQTAAEIARTAGVPAATVRSQLARARHLLRERWRQRHDESSPRGLAGLVLIAGILPESIRQGAIMKSVHSGVVGAACVLVAASLWGGFVLFRSLRPAAAPTESPVLAHVEPEEPTEARATLADVEPDAERESVPVELTVAAKSGPDEAPIQSRLLARVVDSAGRPVPGARMDAPKRAQLGSAESDAAGRITLVADRDSIRVWDGQPQAMVFRITADGHATRFLRAGMERDADTDLGDLELQPGGDVVGRVVDELGTALSGVRVVAGEAALGRAAHEAKLAGPLLEEGEHIASVTAEDGSYRLRGVAAGSGSVRVWANAPGRAWEFSPALDVWAGADTSAPELVLRSSNPEHSIAGVVLSPDGLPLAGAVVEAVAIVAGEFRSQRAEADDAGRFRIVAMSDVPHSVEAFHPSAEARPTHREHVLPGPDDIELRLEPLQWVRIRLLDEEDGSLLEKPWVLLRTNRHLGGSSDVPRPRRETLGPGLVRAPVPQGPFEVSTSAPGYASKSAGNFTAETIPSELEVRLQRKLMMRGRVLADGRPVAGARVQTMRALGDRAMLTQGFRARLFDGGAFAAETDEEGRFEQPVSSGLRSGAHVLHVSKEGWANYEQVVDVSEGDADGIEVVLTRGGTLEGRVLLRDERDAHGALVAASNGDSTVHTTRANELGLYRFENLAPGPWEVRFCEQEEEYVTSFAREPFDGPYEGDCVVVEGGTTRYDVDMRRNGGVVQGWLSIDGRPAKGWTARLEKQKEYESEQLGASVVLDSSGGFELTSDTPATRLVLETLETSEVFAMLTRELSASTAPSDCTVELGTGRLTGSAAPGVQLRCSVVLDAGWNYHATLTADAAGQVAASLPAGTVEISVANVAAGYLRWQEGPRVELPAGGERSFEID